MKLKGKNILITGAAKRVGRTLALALAKKGGNIAVHYRRSKKEANQLVQEIRAMGCKSYSFSADLSKIAQVRRLLTSVRNSFGPIDILINNASNFIRVPFPKIREPDWDKSLDTNLKGPFFLAHEAGLFMRQRAKGTILNMADWAGLEPYPHYLPHSISKAGLIFMTRGLARVLGPHVKVFAIAPKEMKNFQPLARAVVAFLEGKKVRNGATYSVDGCLLVR